ncbi:MAG: hypothetical protein Q9167_002344 [Letrouitia subvulpina]
MPKYISPALSSLRITLKLYERVIRPGRPTLWPAPTIRFYVTTLPRTPTSQTEVSNKHKFSDALRELPIKPKNGAELPISHNGKANSNGTTSDFRITRATLLHICNGVVVATNSSEENVEPIESWISSCKLPEREALAENKHPNTSIALSFRDWLNAMAVSTFDNEDTRRLIMLSLGVAFLREKSRNFLSASMTAADLAIVWRLVYSALTTPLGTTPLSSAYRSAQGFLAVPLCSLIKDGNIEELFRLHVWLPDGQRGNPDLAIHSHQPYAQSWILAGEATDVSYQVELTEDPESATHAEYTLAWSDGKAPKKIYRTSQTYSVAKETSKLMTAKPTNTAIHTRDTTYTIPAAAYHRSEVQPDALHATLFYFDSSRGFQREAGILGPIGAKNFTQLRDPAGSTPGLLANKVNLIRSWEDYMIEGHQHAQQAELEQALRAFNSALNLVEVTSDFPNAIRYKYLVLGELGNINRGFGRYEQAKDVLERATAEMGPTAQRVEFSGELGVVYRNMNRLTDAKRAFEMQYNVAKQLNYEQAACRAIGNLGMVNYQLSQQNHDAVLLQLAIDQLTERVCIARQMNDKLALAAMDPNTLARQRKYARTREVIGLSRLSLCYTAQGNKDSAINAARDSLNVAQQLEEPTVIAMSRFFYGRALLRSGRKTDAMEQFNSPGACTPAIALCREPSKEHRQYLLELVEADVDLDIADTTGNTTLDYAVFNNDAATVQIVIERLRQTLGRDKEYQISQRVTNARLRKGYRELFQEKLRPALLSNAKAVDTLAKLRRVYADALSVNEYEEKLFDGLKVVSYSDFLRFGRLPRSSDALAHQFRPRLSDASTGPEFVIFFSYTRINKNPRALSPDDENNTQYRRMLEAIKQFLVLHPNVDKNNLSIWIDHACVNQDDPMSGVSALPMIITQCDAVISLIDDRYYNRAWCCLEAMMVQTLQTSYGLHLWHEHVQGKGGELSSLRAGPLGLQLSSIAEKELSFEEDRPKLLFLERQSKLLG